MAEREYGDQVFTENIFNKIKAEQGLKEAVAAYNEAMESGKVIIKDVIADAFLQNTLLKPEEYSVVATLNLNGDYIPTSWRLWWWYRDRPRCKHQLPDGTRHL